MSFLLHYITCNIFHFEGGGESGVEGSSDKKHKKEKKEKKSKKKKKKRSSRSLDPFLFSKMYPSLF
jgi:hypothetical protein